MLEMVIRGKLEAHKVAQENLREIERAKLEYQRQLAREKQLAIEEAKKKKCVLL